MAWKVKSRYEGAMLVDRHLLASGPGSLVMADAMLELSFDHVVHCTAEFLWARGRVVPAKAVALPPFRWLLSSEKVSFLRL